MKYETKTSWLRPFQRAPRRAGLLAALLGAVGLLGWLLGIAVLRSTLPGWAALAPLFAVVSMAATLALLAARWLARMQRGGQDADERFAQAFNLSPLALTISRLADGRLIEINETFLHKTGYTRAEALGRTPLELGLWLEPERRARQLQHLQQGLAVNEEEVRFRMKDGAERLCLISAKRIEFGGQPCVMSVVADITERQQAEKEARASREFLNRITDIAPVILYIYDLDETRNVWANRGLFTTLGYTPAEVQELGAALLTQLLHPEDAARYTEYRARRRQLQPGETAAFEYRMRHRDGAWRWLISHEMAFAHDAEGAVTQVIGAAQDITARKEAEHERHKFVSLVENSSEFIATCDLQFRPTYANSAAFRLLGLEDRETAWQIPFQEFFFPEDWQFVTQEFLPRVLREGRAETEIRLRNIRTGAAVWVLYNLFKIKDEQGRTIGLASVSRNITERKEAEEALRASEHRYRSTFENAAVGLAHFGLDASFLHVNERLCQMLGYTRAELLAANWLALSHPDEIQLNLALRERHLRGETADYALEKRYFRKDGSTVWINLTASVQRDEQGAPLYFIAFIEDISARKQAEEALRASEERLRLAAQASGFGFHDYEVQQDRSHWSPELRRLTGVGADAVITFATIGELFHPDDRARMLQQMQAALDPQGTGEFVAEFRIIRPDNGATRWFFNRSQTFFAGAERTPVRNTGVVVDITERKLAEEQIKTANYRYRVAEEAAKGFNYDWDLATDLVTRSESVQQVLGYPREALAPTWAAWAELLHPDDKIVRTEAEARQYLSNYQGDSFSGEYRVRHQDGHYVWMMERGLLLRDEQGQLHRVIGQTVDISERKELEQERERLLAEEQRLREAAEAHNRAKDDFLAVVSHELRSPLNAILGYARLLSARRTQLAPDIREFIEVVKRNGERQNELINDLLDTARITTGKLRLELAPLDLQEVIQDALAAIQPSAQAKNIQVQSAGAATPHAALVLGDAARLQQVVWNLLTNAVKFTDPGGQITVGLRCEPAEATVTVSDTGRGITPAFLPHVFERFSQQDASRTRRHSGLGLGLALVKQLVELHGGTITAASAGAGCGATFTVTLPVRSAAWKEAAPFPAPPGLAAPQAAQSAFLPGVAILLVESEAVTQQLLLALLAGARVTAVATAAAAWPLATAAVRPQLLLCSTELPDEAGYSLLRRLRAWEREHGLTPLPALALTAGDSRHTRLQTLLAGFHMHIAKPLEPAELLLVLKSLLERANLTAGA
jgi:PAS domain S-box-containing protein